MTPNICLRSRDTLLGVLQAFLITGKNLLCGVVFYPLTGVWGSYGHLGEGVEEEKQYIKF